MSFTEAILSIGYWRDILAENLTAQGVAAASSENLASLVPKVLQINSGGTAYSGATSVTPSASAQTLPTAGKTLTDNITVAAIPSNYGLITWNGATLTVS